MYHDTDERSLSTISMKRSNLASLVTDARNHPFGAQASNYRWRAYRRTNGDIQVHHWHTCMITVRPDNRVIRHSEGWGSPTDKSGITRIKGGVFKGSGYDPTVYGEEIRA